MASGPRRGLFWQVYPTLLMSLVLLAVLGALAWHFSGLAPMTPQWRPGPPSAHAHLRMRLHSLGMLLGVAAVVGLAAWPVVARITRRLEALRLGVEAWGAGDLARRVAVEGNDEIAAVAASFNRAADRADELLSAHKTMLAQASHELRSPLARLSLAVEMVEGAPEATLAAVRREIGELDALIGEILLASRLDHDPGRTDTERVDCLALAAEEAARADISLAGVDPAAGPFETAGSSRLLRRMIRNLIDNALRHGAAPVEIAVRRERRATGERVVIEVRDRGAGVAPELAERVFEPFFRPQGWSEEAGSWGLGLALVRQIARRHGGEARCAHAEGVTTFSVDLPAA